MPPFIVQIAWDDVTALVLAMLAMVLAAARRNALAARSHEDVPGRKDGRSAGLSGRAAEQPASAESIREITLCQSTERRL